MKIKILKNGPYLVTGDVPLSEKIIVRKGKHNEWEQGRELPQSQTYSLCRCGKSKTPPFCDGTHAAAHFEGTETASRAPYSKRITDKVEGPGVTLLDDGRCAYARFCHRDKGDVWQLTDRSDNPELRDGAIKAATDCPAGRLTMLDKNGEAIEPELAPSIEILQDPGEGVSGSIYVKGNIPIESSDGSTYEIRNRVTLCRCGKSRNKPFCDAMHVNMKYSDGHVK